MEKVETKDKKSKDSDRRKWWKENLISLGTALFLVLIIRSSVIEAFKIPSGSMIPTLLVGDYIFVNKFSYGLKLPFTEWFLDEPVFITRSDPPSRGDIIVFKYPRDESIYYIKRVVGLPGDLVEVRNKVLFINQKEVPRENLVSDHEAEIRQDIDPTKYNVEYLQLYRESFKDHQFTMMIDDSQYMTSQFGPIQVPQDHYFVMGDNRDHSHDSRIWGFVPFKNIKGRAFLVWLSLWLDFGESEFSFRPSRTGTLLE